MRLHTFTKQHHNNHMDLIDEYEMPPSLMASLMVTTAFHPILISAGCWTSEASHLSILIYDWS